MDAHAQPESSPMGTCAHEASRCRRARLRLSLIVWAVAFVLGAGSACGEGREAVTPEQAQTAVTAPAEKAAPQIPRSARPDAARVYFIAPVDGQQVSSPFTVRFGLGKMGVAPAGVVKEATGHHHLVIDTELPPLTLPIPSSENYRHFGAGQTEVELELPPGQHTLQLLLGDHLHMPHLPPVVSERITINVQ